MKKHNELLNVKPVIKKVDNQTEEEFDRLSEILGDDMQKEFEEHNHIVPADFKDMFREFERVVPDYASGKPTRYVLTINDKVVGIGSMYINTYAYIRSIYVLPEYRNLKLGYKILKHLINNSENKDMLLVTLKTNKNVIEFYKRNGFVITDKVVADADYLMERKVK